MSPILVVCLGSLAVCVGLVLWSLDVLRRAKEFHDKGEQIAMDHNMALVQINQNQLRLQRELEKPCPNCGAVRYSTKKEKP